jgi:hypothetical protein
MHSDGRALTVANRPKAASHSYQWYAAQSPPMTLACAWILLASCDGGSPNTFA